MAELDSAGRMIVRCLECEHEHRLALEGWEAYVCDNCGSTINRPVLELRVSYHKVGVDWQSALDAAGGKVPKALEVWAERLRRDATRLCVLASALRESGAEDLTAEGDAHVAWIGGLDSEVEMKIRGLVPDVVCDWKVEEPNA